LSILYFIERLRDYFSKFGEVLDCVVMRDAATGKSRGFAFLTFADSRVVDDVASRTHQLDGKNVRYCPNQVVISHLANTLVD
jgi:hypothetical protein